MIFKYVKTSKNFLMMSLSVMSLIKLLATFGISLRHHQSGTICDPLAVLHPQCLEIILAEFGGDPKKNVLQLNGI